MNTSGARWAAEFRVAIAQVLVAPDGTGIALNPVVPRMNRGGILW